MGRWANDPVCVWEACAILPLTAEGGHHQGQWRWCYSMLMTTKLFHFIVSNAYLKQECDLCVTKTKWESVECAKYAPSYSVTLTITCLGQLCSNLLESVAVSLNLVHKTEYSAQDTNEQPCYHRTYISIVSLQLQSKSRPWLVWNLNLFLSEALWFLCQLSTLFWDALRIPHIAQCFLHTR